MVTSTTTTATRTNTTTVCLPTTTAVVVPTTSAVVVPTPIVHTCPTPGTYTFPATTVTVTATTTVCAATTTEVPAGTHTVGGVTTVVETSTTVICPVAHVSTSGTVVTSTISLTTYVCPSAGTYTIAPTTTTVTEATTITYVVPTSYVPGVYTAPKEVVTVTKTDYTTICPLTKSGLPTTTAAPAPPAVTTQAPPPPAVTTAAAPKPVVVLSVPAVVPSPAPKQQQQQQSSQSGSPKIITGELRSTSDIFGLTYTPYQPSTGHCKTADEVDADIASLKQKKVPVIRVYSTDCDTLENVGAACKKHDIQMIIGVFVKGTGCSYNSPDIKKQVDAIASWSSWDNVELFVVGNEAIMNNFCTPQELRQLIVDVKSKCPGYKGPYTISETLNIWQRQEVASAICGVVDVTGANIHAFFNSNVAPHQAGDFVAGQLEILKGICQGNDVINLESGWPESGNPNGLAVAGKQEQAIAIDSIRKKCGNKTVFFSFENDLWKAPGTCNCEQSWGMSSLFQVV